jgi:hypothetical protein
VKGNWLLTKFYLRHLVTLYQLPLLLRNPEVTSRSAARRGCTATARGSCTHPPPPIPTSPCRSPQVLADELTDKCKDSNVFELRVPTEPGRAYTDAIEQLKGAVRSVRATGSTCLAC